MNHKLTIFLVFAAASCTSRNSGGDESQQVGSQLPTSASKCSLPPPIKRTLLFADPDFKEDCELSTPQKDFLRNKKRDLMSAGIIAPCSDPSQIPPEERKKLVEQGVLPRLVSESQEFARVNAKVGGGASIDPWFITPEQRSKLEQKGVPVPKLASELDPGVRNALIKEGALPRANSSQERAQAQKIFFSQMEEGNADFRFSTLTAALFESAAFCVEFYKKRANP